MATASKFYNKFFEAALKSALADLSSAGVTVRVALVTSSYDMATATTGGADAHNFYSNLTNEVTGTGYTAGGAALASKTVTKDTTNDRGTFDAADLTWTTATVTARGCVLYVDTGTPSTSPLICYIDFGADKTTTAADFTIQWSASGIFYLN